MIEEFSKIKGFLEQKEGVALYEACKLSFKTGKCAEIGSYCGKSACYIGLACKEVGSKLYSVDHHRGSEEQQYGEEYFDKEIYNFSAKQVNTLPLFLKNIRKFNLQDHIEPMVMTSVDASFKVPDNLDLIFIDGSHTFESARNDYLHWKPKLRPGGVLAIHDVYDSEEEGGQAPKEIYLKALTDGFKLKERINSLVLLN
mgnify:FL=1